MTLTTEYPEQARTRKATFYWIHQNRKKRVAEPWLIAYFGHLIDFFLITMHYLHYITLKIHFLALRSMANVIRVCIIRTQKANGGIRYYIMRVWKNKLRAVSFTAPGSRKNGSGDQRLSAAGIFLGKLVPARPPVARARNPRQSARDAAVLTDDIKESTVASI